MFSSSGAVSRESSRRLVVFAQNFSCFSAAKLRADLALVALCDDAASLVQGRFPCRAHRDTRLVLHY